MDRVGLSATIPHYFCLINFPLCFVQQWIYRRKLALLVVLVNVTLTFLFYQLLTYRTEYDDGDDYE